MRLIGVYMVVTGVPKVINEGIKIVASYQKSILAPQHSTVVLLHTWSEGIAAIIYLGLGIYLLAGGSILSKLQNVVDRNKD